MQTKLVELYRSIDNNVRKIYVFPRIKLMSKYNPYLELFYSDFLSPSKNNTNIVCTSPHPLLPLFVMKKLFGERSIVHHHWLEFSDFQGLLVLLWKMGTLLLYKFTGGNIVWSVHNKYPHRNKHLFINSFFQRLMASIAVKIHVHCKEAVTIMIPILKAAPDKFCIIEHPIYSVKRIDHGQARTYLVKEIIQNINTSKPLFLMFGNIAEYKGIIDIIPIIEEDIGQLIIAGKCKKGETIYLHRIEKAVAGKKHIHLINRFISKEEEIYLFNAIDCVIFNFSDILSSGSVILALSYKKDMVVPNIGCLKELSGPNIFKFNSQSELKNQIEAVAAKRKNQRL